MDKILVVDEDSNERNGLCRLLEHAGYEVRSAADGVEALQKVRNDNFDLMLLDIWMTRMDGLELLAQLPKECRPKAMVITGDEAPETVLRSLREEADAFIPKPFRPSDLLRLIKDTLATRSASIQSGYCRPNELGSAQVPVRHEDCDSRGKGRTVNKGLPLEVREPDTPENSMPPMPDVTPAKSKIQQANRKLRLSQVAAGDSVSGLPTNRPEHRNIDSRPPR